MPEAMHVAADHSRLCLPVPPPRFSLRPANSANPPPSRTCAEPLDLLHSAARLDVGKRSRHVTGRPLSEYTPDLLLAHRMPADDADDGVHGGPEAPEIDLRFGGKSDPDRPPEYRHRAHQPLVVRWLDPRFGGWPCRHVDMDDVGPEFFQHGGDVCERLFRIVQPLDEHDLGPEFSAVRFAKRDESVDVHLERDRPVRPVDAPEHVRRTGIDRREHRIHAAHGVADFR